MCLQYSMGFVTETAHCFSFFIRRPALCPARFAVPSMLIVAPSGSTKDEISEWTPISSQRSLVTGSEATDEVEVKAKAAARSDLG